MDIGPRVRALFGISGPGSLDLNAGIEVAAPNLRASITAEASTADEVRIHVPVMGSQKDMLTL